MSDRLYDALEICLEAVRTGVDPERCLALYPELAEELRPALEASRRAAAIDLPDTRDASHRSRDLLMQRLSGIREQQPLRQAALGLRLALVGLAVLVAIIFTGSGLFAVSAQTLPGDSLYPVKRSFEDLSVALVPDSQSRQRLEEQYQQRRVDEVSALLAQQRVETVAFQGILDTPSAGDWEVGGIQILVSEQTEVFGQPESGMLVEVTGRTEVDGIVRAHTVRVRLLRLAGKVDEIRTEGWIIQATPVTINEQTLLDPEIQIHDQVIALLLVEDDGSFTALAVFRLLPSVLETLPTPRSEPTGEPAPATPEHMDGEHEVAFTGIVESISANQWTIAGRVVAISAETDIEDDIAVGDLVRVQALEMTDGSLTAEEIERLEDEHDGEDQENNDDDADHEGDEQEDDEHESEDEHEDEDDESDEEEQDEDDKSSSIKDVHSKV